MRGRLRAITGHTVRPLSAGWEMAECESGGCDAPAAADQAGLDWVPAVVPSTAASTLRDAGRWSLDGAARRFDAVDWWYRTRFSAEPIARDEQLWLCFDGIATVAEVWLNGTSILTSEGMFTGRDCRVDEHLRPENDLAIRFRSLDALLKQRRPRPHWRAPMVENQQVRWFRATLLGRTPGWSPPAQAVGPWRDIRLERRRGVALHDVRLRAGADGKLGVSLRVESLAGIRIGGADVILTRNDREHSAALSVSDDAVSGQLVVRDAEKWWPHTHGESPLYSARVRLHAGNDSIDVDLGRVGFRSVGVNTADDGFAVYVNRVPVFCRGACWTPLDVVTLDAGESELDRAFDQVVGAGMNMLRVGGMMVYESDAFLDRCDARGVLLWHDFMFSNMEYPEDDPAFKRVVDAEIGQQLLRLQGRPSVSVLCGNSEGEQQAAMWGASRNRWQPALFTTHIAELAREICPDVPYWPSSTHGGDFPHQGDAGTSSYYGVGAYLRPIEDARRAGIRFATECLAFANIPEPQAMALLPNGLATKVHDPSWKARTPRDLGAGWDFDDVRDHYTAQLFRADLLRLRYADHERYLALSRVASGEVMAEVFSEWRRRHSRTQGGLVWFLRDLWPGAGWGIIDANGVPKAPWFYLKRALAPVAVSLSDEGGNGLGVHIVNDLAEPLAGELELRLFRFGEVQVGRGVKLIELAPRSAVELNAVALFDTFVDVSYAYRFGPPSHDVVCATLRDAAGVVRARAFHFAAGLPNAREMDIGLHAEARQRAGAIELTVRARKLAQSVTLEFEGFESEDNYFHLAPGDERILTLRPVPGTPALSESRGMVHALNAATSVSVTLRGE
jgi:beta-mannosidase